VAFSSSKSHSRIRGFFLLQNFIRGILPQKIIRVPSPSNSPFQKYFILFLKKY